MSNSHNLYFHVPFCKSKCNYCAFYSIACANPDWDGYCGRILREIDRWHDGMGKIDVPTIFFGGGTPSLMPTNVFARIMDQVRQKFSVAPGAEVTLESNPGTIDRGRLIEFQSAGANRLSVGVQSLDDDELRFLGRGHNAAAAVRLIRDAQDLGLRVSGDFIYGLPKHTAGDVIKLCRRINELGLEHCSMYELSIEPGTPFARMNPDMPDNETMAQMYEAIGKTLNLPRYEVSNYAAPGAKCRHNQNVWAGMPYIGLGDGAAGRVRTGGAWHEQMGAGRLFKKMDNSARALEMLITGLRTIRGVKITPDIRNIINWDFAGQNPKLLEVAGDYLRATEKGMLILDDLLVRLAR
jgi:oxygen-independent coproporphyrinogen-3 oxidase